MVLVSVGMKEKAMRWDVSSRHTPFVLVAKRFAIRFQNNVPITTVSRAYIPESANLRDVRNAFKVLVSSSHTRYSSLRLSCWIREHLLPPNQNIQQVRRELRSHWSSCSRHELHDPSSGPPRWRRGPVDRPG